MPRQVLFALFIEATLIALTTLLLTQPRPFFALDSARSKSVATTGGFVLLCLTFCWSVIVGCILTLNGFTFKL